MKPATPYRNRSAILLISIFLALTTVSMTGLTACSPSRAKVEAANLMEGISSGLVSGKTADEAFIVRTADFSIELFKKSVSSEENALVSPLSVLLALAMTTNGADGETLSQMEMLLGGDIPIGELNEYLFSYVKNLPNEEDSKLAIANSIWFRDNADLLSVEKNFLQKNADFYNAALYKSAFDEQTVSDINNWVSDNTDGLITKVLEEIDGNALMFLINAVVFDARWETVYEKNQIGDGFFTAINGKMQAVEFMNSKEALYLDDGRATGFIKPYIDNHYSFAALLPNVDVPIEEYIVSLTGDGFLEVIKNAEKTEVVTALPKFSYDYSITMNNILRDLGMLDALDPDLADFSKLGRSSLGNIFIGDVLHKTFISVDELGTKAGAVTVVQMSGTSMPEKTVTLDRPFVYAILDNATGLPIFIGTVMGFEE